MRRPVLHKIIAAAAVFAAGVLPTLVAAQPAAAAATPVVSVTPLIDAPGSAAMTIVTVTNIPTGWTVNMSARVGSLPTSCEYRWRHGTAMSQQCYVTLPAKVGSWTLRGTATLAKAGSKARVYTGTLTVKTAGPATIPVSAAVRAQITNCYSTSGYVRLTFDDGFSSQSNLNSILATLKAYNVKAVFFPTGVWTHANPAMIRQIKAAGQSLGNHTYSHPHLITLTNSAFRYQVANGQAGTTAPKLLRPPGGAGAYSARSYALAAAAGYRLCYWGVDTLDWSKVSSSVIVNKVLRGDNRTPPVRAGGAVLMHMSNTQARYALAPMIKGIRAKGLKLQPLR